jgi:hypothetical protein
VLLIEMSTQMHALWEYGEGSRDELVLFIYIYIYIYININIEQIQVGKAIVDCKKTIHCKSCSLGVDCEGYCGEINWGSPMEVEVGVLVWQCAMMCLEWLVLWRWWVL